MSQFGDTYSYKIDVSASGVNDAQRFADAVNDVGQKTEAAGRKAAQSSRMFGELANVATGSRAAMAQFAQTLSAFAVMADDVVYGSKNIANNLIAIGMMAPDPRVKVFTTTVGLLTAAFHEQIDVALEYVGVLDERVTRSVDTANKAMAGWVARFGGQTGEVAAAAKSIDEVFQGIGDAGRKSLVDTMLGEGAGMEAIDNIRNEMRALGQGGFFAPLLGMLGIATGKTEALQKRLDEAIRGRAGQVKAEVEKMMADAAGGDDAAIQRLADLARRSGLPEMADALERNTTAFGQLNARAEEFVAKVEKMRAAEERAKETGADWLKRKIRDLQDAVKAAQRAAAEEVKIEKEKQDFLESLAKKEWERKQDVNANAFRQQLAPGIASTIFGAMGRGATQEQAEGLAINQAASVMQNAGMNGMQAVSTAMKLVQEQMEWIQQQNANMDALLGLMVGQFRANTMGRRQAAAQANQIRRMQLMQNAQNPWMTNRPGWP